MERPLLWITMSAGCHVDASRQYQICQDEGTWVLTSTRSLVRHFPTLRDAKLAAEDEEATKHHERFDSLEMVAQGEVVKRQSGWVILHKPQHGVWREVAGPYRTRCHAREVREIAWLNWRQLSHHGNRGVTRKLKEE